MTITFKNGTTKNCEEITEQKIFRGGNSIGWLCTIRLEDMTSEEIDELFSAANTSEITFTKEDGEVQNLEGYAKLTSAIVRHTGVQYPVEIQLSKGF